MFRCRDVQSMHSCLHADRHRASFWGMRSTTNKIHPIGSLRLRDALLRGPGHSCSESCFGLASGAPLAWVIVSLPESFFSWSGPGRHMLCGFCVFLVFMECPGNFFFLSHEVGFCWARFPSTASPLPFRLAVLGLFFPKTRCRRPFAWCGGGGSGEWHQVYRLFQGGELSSNSAEVLCVD